MDDNRVTQNSLDFPFRLRRTQPTFNAATFDALTPLLN
jgi:hypothetical protein